MSKVSEDERFNAKNYYKLNKEKLQFADKKRQAVTKSKLVDMLKNQGEIKQKLEDEINTYTDEF